MKYLTLISFLLALIADARAGRVIPPERYDHEFAGEVIHTEMPNEAKLRKICEGFGSVFTQSKALGCAFAYRGKCFIFTVPYIDMLYSNTGVEMIMRHERAHCNGWAPNHPD
jgi:hypothetical protein